MIQGQAVEVRIQPRGSQVVGDTASGSATVKVLDPTSFDPAGGMVQIDGINYTYTNLVETPDADDPGATNGIMTLVGGLFAAVSDGTQAVLWTGAQVLDDVVLVVDTGEDQPTVEVTVTTNQRKDWELFEGALAPPVDVNLSDDLTQLLDAPGHTPNTGLPYAQARGAITIAFTDATNGSGTVTFPSGRFTVAPMIVGLATKNFNYSAGYSFVTATGFTISIKHVTDAVLTGAVEVTWKAEQATPSSASD